MLVFSLLGAGIADACTGMYAGKDETSAGGISGGEFERIEIVGGKVFLGVSVSTNSEVKARSEGQGWCKADIGHAQVEDDGTVTLTIPAPADKGFMILKSKGATK